MARHSSSTSAQLSIAMFGATAALLAGASDDARLGRAWGWKLEARGEPIDDWGG